MVPDKLSRRSLLKRTPEFALAALALAACVGSSPRAIDAATSVPNLAPPSADITSAPLRCIHIGSHSQDEQHFTSYEDILPWVQAISTYLFNANCIAIGTPIDQPQRILDWVQAISEADKIPFIRSTGPAEWQTGMTPDEYLEKLPQYLEPIADQLPPGTILEPVPDESENNPYWNQQLGGFSQPTTQDAFNQFIQQGIAIAEEYVPDWVDVRWVTTAPYASKEVLTADTKSLLPAISTQNYPELGQSITTPDQARAGLTHELTDWVATNQPDQPKHITFASHVTQDLGPQILADMYTQRYQAIIDLLGPQTHLTVWQAGNRGNDQPSRLFDFDPTTHEVHPRQPLVDVVNASFALP